MRRSGVGILVAAAALSFAALLPAFPPSSKPSKSKPESADARGPVLVIVNGQKITEPELNRLITTHRVPPEKRDEVRRSFLDKLIDMRLVQQYLASRKVAAGKKEVDDQIKQIRAAAGKRGEDPDQALAEAGYTPEWLREQIALPIAWQHYFDRVVPPEKLKAYFKEHHEEFDGTKVRASRILIKVPSGDDTAYEAAEAKLSELRKQILEKKISFAEAASEHSAAPSAGDGGNVGEFPFSGKMFKQFSQEAFRLKEGEISQPFRTKYGAELCLVTDKKPGDLSLEDVRDEVRARMSDELLNETRAELRKNAKIEWRSEPP